MNTVEKRETIFSKITSVDDMIAYLDDDSSRLENREYFYHYTKIDNVVKTFISKKWHLGNAQSMNDKLEYSNGDKERWNNIFFASFMTDAKESIGMWSMYAQPWKDGVSIAIPRKEVRKWIKSVTEIEEISCSDFKPTGKKVIIDNNSNRLLLSSVAYTNCDNPETDEKITWSSATNTLIRNASHIPELTGYIKDSAWDYEREIRIKAVLSEGHGFQRVAINVPDNIFNSMTITAGPLFEGNLEKRLMDKINRQVKANNSLFHNRLSISNACNDCKLRGDRP